MKNAIQLIEEVYSELILELKQHILNEEYKLEESEKRKIKEYLLSNLATVMNEEYNQDKLNAVYKAELEVQKKLKEEINQLKIKLSKLEENRDLFLNKDYKLYAE